MTKALAKNEKLLELAEMSNDPAMTTADLEKWLGDVTAENDEIVKKARDYIDQCPDQDKTSQSSRQTTTVRRKSSKATSSKISKTSSQRHCNLIIAQQRREAIESQNEATRRLAKQKQQLELEQLELELKMRKEQALRVEELEEENRRKLAEAILVEMEIREDVSESNADFHKSLSRLGASSEGEEKARINDWVNNLPSAAQTEMHPSIGAQATKALTDTLEVQPTPQSFPFDDIASAPVTYHSRIPEVNPTTTTQRATF